MNNDQLYSSLGRFPAVVVGSLLSYCGKNGADFTTGAVSKEVGKEAATRDCVAVASPGLDT